MLNNYFNPLPTFIAPPVGGLHGESFGIAEVVLTSGDAVVIKPAVEVVLIEPKLRFRAVTPTEQIKNGTATACNSEGYLKPSLGEFQRVASVLAEIDDEFSYSAAVEKFAKKIANPEPAPAPVTDPAPTPVTDPAPKK